MKHNYLIFNVFIALASCGDTQGKTDTENEAVSDKDPEIPGLESDFYRECTSADCSFDVAEGSGLDLGAGTWHRRDTGVGLVGNPAVLSVVDEFSGHPDAYRECYLVSLFGAWSDDVHVFLTLTGEWGPYGIWEGEDLSDLNLQTLETGYFEVTKEVNASQWEPWHLEVKALQERGRLSFIFEKVGYGEARFYYIKVSSEQYCSENAVKVDG